jgi:hypothetical protein
VSDGRQPSMLIPWPPMTIIPGSAAPPEAEARDLDYRRGDNWFPKAFGLWRVQGGALALLSWSATDAGGILSNE